MLNVAFPQNLRRSPLRMSIVSCSLLLVASLLFSGCGSNDDSESPDTPSTSDENSSDSAESGATPDPAESGDSPTSSTPATTSEPAWLDPESENYPTLPPPSPTVTYPDGSTFAPLVPAPTTSYPR
jgi:hypothetical protein